MESTDFQEQQELNQQEEEKLEITHFIKVDLAEAAKWGKFLSIVGFIIIGLMTVIFFFMGIFLSLKVPNAIRDSAPGLLSHIFMLIIIGLQIYPTYALFKFSTRIKYAMNYDDNIALEEAFRYLKGLFRYLGIYVIVVLSIYAIIFVFGAAIGLGSAIG